MSRHRGILVLAALVCVAALALVWVLTDTEADDARGVTSADSARATVASAAVKDEARDVAADAAAAAYSYTWRTLDDDRAAARALMTTAMQDRYDRTMAGVATQSRRDRAIVSAEVVDTALVTASAEHARVLVFVNQRTSGEHLDEPTLDLDRVLVTLERSDRGGDGWKVSELDAL